MNRRKTIGVVAAAIVGGIAPIRVHAKPMNTIAVGPWEFEAPIDWKLQENSTTVPYMEAPDGTRGCYIKALTFGQTRKSAVEAADYLQEVHERNFLKDPEANWKTVERVSSHLGQTARPVLDLLDETSNYRVLSVVLATEREALQVTVHDYDCKDYGSSKRLLAPIAESLRGPKPGV